MIMGQRDDNCRDSLPIIPFVSSNVHNFSFYDRDDSDNTNNWDDRDDISLTFADCFAEVP